MVLLGDVFTVLLQVLPADTESANHPEGLTVFVCYKVYTESVNTLDENLMVFVCLLQSLHRISEHRCRRSTVFVCYKVYTESVNTRVIHA